MFIMKIKDGNSGKLMAHLYIIILYVHQSNAVDLQS